WRRRPPALLALGGRPGPGRGALAAGAGRPPARPLRPRGPPPPPWVRRRPPAPPARAAATGPRRRRPARSAAPTPPGQRSVCDVSVPRLPSPSPRHRPTPPAAAVPPPPTGNP